MSIQWKGSPNYDKNRKPITKIVIHWFGVGDLNSANNRFQSASSGVSAHYGISDDTVFQWVKEEHVAYHAGNYEVNQESIGIEHDATTTKNASEKTYQTSGQLVADICKRHSIPLDREHIIGHNQVKATACPGTLDIDKIINLAKGDNMDIDIPSDIEEKFKLKEIDRYNKYWTYEELINDWVKLVGEYEYEKGEKEKYKKEARELREVVKSQAEEIAKILKEVESLSHANASQYAEIQSLQGQFSDVSRERDGLLDAVKGYEIVIPKLKVTISDLEDKIASQNPISEYSWQDLVSELFNRLFSKGGV